MNKFDIIFFKQFVPSWVKIKNIVHEHIIVIINKIITNYFFFVILPSFFYYYSDTFKSIIPFFVLEIFLLGVFLKTMYDVFDWYNDVWIVTEDGITELDWYLFSNNTVSIKYRNVEWLELVQNWIIDSILWKWDLVIHKIWWEKFVLYNASNVYEVVNQIDKISKNKKPREKKDDKSWNNDEIFEEENSETKKQENPKNEDVIIKALSKVVKNYLEENWYEKNKKEDEKIKEIAKKTWTINLSKSNKSQKDEEYDE